MDDITFTIGFIGDDTAEDTILRGISAYTDFNVDLVYRSDVAPYCANPVNLARTTRHGAVIVHELDDDGMPDAEREHTIPLQALTGINVL
jgi:hypothetical protein